MSPRNRGIPLAVVIVAIVAVGCARPAPTEPPATDATQRKQPPSARPPGPGVQPAPTGTPGAGPGAGATATPAPVGTPSGVPTPRPAIAGRVLDAQGQPAAGATVTAYLPDGDGKPVVTAKADAEGRYSFEPPGPQALNLVAELGGARALRRDVAPGPPGADMRLGPVGTIKGRVAAPKAPGIKDLSGVVVMVPGTPFRATTAADGAYAITGVPFGQYDLFGSKAGLGMARASGVAVREGVEAAAPELAFDLVTPVLETLSATSGGAGLELRLTGTNLGGAGEPLQVLVGGVAVVMPTRADATTIVAKVPEGAKSGEVLVKLGELPSNGLPFRVIASLALAPTEKTVLVGGIQTFELSAKDEAGVAIEAPAVTWEGTPAVVSVDATGAAEAIGPGTGRVTVRSGGVSATATLEVLPFLATVDTLAGSTPGYQDGSGPAGRFQSPADLALGADGALYVADYGNNRVRRVTAAGEVTTFAGTGDAGGQDGPLASAQFELPVAIGRGADGALYVGEELSARLRMIKDGTVSALNGAGGRGYADGPAAGARFRFVLSPAAAADGTLYLADKTNHRVRSLAAGNVGTLAGDGTAGHQDGQAASARFNGPTGVAVGPDGAVYVADAGNHCIRRIVPAKDASQATVSTFAGAAGQAGMTDGPRAEARFKGPSDLCFDGRGNMIVLDAGNLRVRLIDPAGRVYGVAGDGTAGDTDAAGSAARFKSLDGVTAGDADRVYVVDKGNARIRRITLTWPK